MGLGLLTRLGLRVGQLLSTRSEECRLATSLWNSKALPLKKETLYLSDMFVAYSAYSLYQGGLIFGVRGYISDCAALSRHPGVLFPSPLLQSSCESNTSMDGGNVAQRVPKSQYFGNMTPILPLYDPVIVWLHLRNHSLKQHRTPYWFLAKKRNSTLNGALH